MNVDITIAPPFTDSTQRRQIALYTGPNPYVPGTGDVLSPEDFRMGKIFAVLAGVGVGAAAYLPYYAPDNGAGVPAIFWYDPTTGNEVGGIDLSAVQVVIEVVGQ